jgi:hypothetical protein
MPFCGRLELIKEIRAGPKGPVFCFQLLNRCEKVHFGRIFAAFWPQIRTLFFAKNC